MADIGWKSFGVLEPERSRRPGRVLLLLRHAPGPVYWYLLAWRPDPGRVGASHGVVLPFVFGTHLAAGWRGETVAVRRLGDRPEPVESRSEAPIPSGSASVGHTRLRRPDRTTRARSPFTMSVRIVRLGSARVPGEGTRIGTVRRPPRGVPKEQFSKQNWYDVWFPNVAPSLETMKLGRQASSEAEWSAFARKYRAEMAAPGARHAIELLAVLSHATDFSVGCYCENEERCHRSILRQLLAESGAQIA